MSRKNHRARADEDPNGIMAEMSSLMTPINATPTKTKSTGSEEEEVQQRILKGKNEVKALHQARASSEAAVKTSKDKMHEVMRQRGLVPAAVKTSKSKLREVMRHRGLVVSGNKKVDVDSLINSFYRELES